MFRDVDIPFFLNQEGRNRRRSRWKLMVFVDVVGTHWRYTSTRWVSAPWYYFSCSLGLGAHFANIIHLHFHDGVKGFNWCIKDSHLECKLHGKAFGGRLFSLITRVYIFCLFQWHVRDPENYLLLILYAFAKQKHYPILFRGVNGTVAHEFIVDLRGFKVIDSGFTSFISSFLLISNQ